jgi:hypothetical protein
MVEKNIDSTGENYLYQDINSGKILTLPFYRFTQSRINSKGLPELKKSLLEIDDIIKNCKSKLIESVLLEKKRLIIDRIQEISSLKKMENLQDMVSQLPDEEAKQRLTNELNVLREGAKKYRQELQDISEAEAKIKLEQQKLDGLERKSKIWLSFLQRESAASIIGGIVLLMLTVALISGMIFGRESQILSNGFLVILGYFFGQSSSKNKDSI